jgi:hypothetical protein
VDEGVTEGVPDLLPVTEEEVVPEFVAVPEPVSVDEGVTDGVPDLLGVTEEEVVPEFV